MRDTDVKNAKVLKIRMLRKKFRYIVTIIQDVEYSRDKS